jgi:hypothetical protein
MLDQEVAAARPLAEQGAQFIEGARVDLAALRRPFGPAAAAARIGNYSAI